MVHATAKNKIQVTYNELVEMSPFYNNYILDSTTVPQTRIPDYLAQKNKDYGLNNHSLLKIWSIIFNGMKQSEKIIGENDYDIRYKSLFIWSKYFLSYPNNDLETFQVMQSQQEDAVLVALVSILSTLKEVNLKFNSSTINNQDLQTAIHLCLNKVRVYKHELATIEDDLEFDEEVEQNPYEIEVYDEGEEDQNFEGFNLYSRMKFEVFLTTHFKPLKNELDLKSLEDAVYKVLNSKITRVLKHQNLNFFTTGFKIPSLE
jgi:hypothetical protein